MRRVLVELNLPSCLDGLLPQVHACLDAIVSGAPTVVIRKPEGTRWPRKWPRGECLSVGHDGMENWSFDPARVLGWVHLAAQEWRSEIVAETAELYSAVEAAEKEGNS